MCNDDGDQENGDDDDDDDLVLENIARDSLLLGCQ